MYSTLTQQEQVHGPIAGTTYQQCTTWRQYVAARLPATIQALSPMRFKEFLATQGLHATFMTKPYKGLSGSCCHFHVSLLERGTGHNIFLDPEAEHGVPSPLR